ncbi:MAG: EVE domain-containing protein [Cyanobacteria bacterium P01_H01_bin.121]
MNYWLMKSEPDVYSIEDLRKDGQTIWDGVRNYQARNLLKTMQLGDRAFFYHSNTKPPGVVGLMQVCAECVVDPTQFDASSKYYDPKATLEKPRWHTVTVEFVEAFKSIITLDQLKTNFEPDELWVVRRGNRLSVIPVEAAIADRILKLAKA